MSVLRNIDLPILADEAQSPACNDDGRTGDLRLGLAVALACWVVIVAFVTLVV